MLRLDSAKPSFRLIAFFTAFTLLPEEPPPVITKSTLEAPYKDTLLPLLNGKALFSFFSKVIPSSITSSMICSLDFLSSSTLLYLES